MAYCAPSARISLLVAALTVAAPAVAQEGIANVSNFGAQSFSSPNDSEASQNGELTSDFPAGGVVQSFIARFGVNVNADSKSTSRSKLVDFEHEVSFEVRSSLGYTLRISSGWVGEMARRADTLECADAVVLSGVTGDVIAGFGLSSGSLSLADPPDITLLTSGDETVPFGEAVDAQVVVRTASPVEIHTLRFSWNAGVISNTCEAALRMGADNESTTECTLCEYPGDPARVKSADGHFVFVEFVQSMCGNGQVDSGEQCDLGSGNGFGACCDTACRLEPEEMPCQDDELFCTGDGRCRSGVCTSLGDPCAGQCAVCDESADQCVPCVPTPTPTATPGDPTLTATADATATPTAPTSACAGDCDGDGEVSVNELITGVTIALGQRPAADCLVLDANGDAAVSISELVAAVDRALNTCG